MTAVVMAQTDNNKTFQLIDTFAQAIRPTANLFTQILNASFCHRDCFPEFTRYCISDFNDGPVRCIEFIAPTRLSPTPAPYMKMSLHKNNNFERLAVEEWFNAEGYRCTSTSKNTTVFRTFGCTIEFEFLPYVNILQSVTVVWQ